MAYGRRPHLVAMLDLLRLTRPLNLLIIALTMYLMRSGLLRTLLEANGRHLRMSATDFALLVLSTVLVAAAGNIINDYFDTRIDRINKPGEVIVGRTVKRRVAMALHIALSAVGFLLGLYVAWHNGLLRWALIPAFAIGALWTYSTSWKRKFLIGNGLVATLTALVPLTVGLYEIPLLQRHESAGLLEQFGDPGLVEFYFNALWVWIAGYAVFAFLSTLVRELQKDMADVKGDKADGCRTVPIVMGMGWARGLVIFHVLVMVAGLLGVRRLLLDDEFSFWYIGLGVIAPLLLSAGLTYSARERTDHVRAGIVMKLAMVMAVGYVAFLKLVLFAP